MSAWKSLWWNCLMVYLHPTQLFKKRNNFGLCNANSLPVNANVLNEPIIHRVAGCLRNCLLIALTNSTTDTFAIYNCYKEQSSENSQHSLLKWHWILLDQGELQSAVKTDNESSSVFE